MTPAPAPKRWSTDRRAWWRLRRSTSRIVRHEDVVLVRLEALDVVEPLWVTCAGARIKILDVGYTWLFICRDGARHVVTAHCDAHGQPVHWYIDVVERWVPGADGFPIYDDLFLDVAATPSGLVELLDEDELDHAMRSGTVTPEQHAAAREEAERVVEGIRAGSFEPIARTTEFLSLAADAAGLPR